MGMEKEEEEEGGEAHLYSSVDCRVSAVVVQFVGKRWASFRNITLLDLSSYNHYKEYDRNKRRVMIWK